MPTRADGAARPSQDDQPAGAVVPAIVVITLVGLGMSLALPLLALEMERMGVSSTLQGLNTAAGGIANILAVPFVPGLAARIGVRRLITGAVLIAAACIIAFKLVPSIGLWFVIRLAFGASLGALFTLSEYWIASTAPSARRGLIMGIYATALSIGFAAGPTLLVVTSTVGWLPYLAAAGVMLAGLLALVVSRFDPPPPRGDSHPANVLAMIGSVPAATLAAFTVGAIETAGIVHLAIIGVRSGYTESAAALFVATFAAGNIVSQIPMGLLADRMDKRRLLIGLAITGLVATVLFAWVLASAPLAMLALFVAGGSVGALYTVGLSLLGSRFQGMQLASANAAFVILYSSGLTLGPPLAGVGLDVIGPSGFAVAVVLILAVYLVVAGRRPAG